jgi:quercetin dioxygenase-like cupin family protein
MAAMLHVKNEFVTQDRWPLKLTKLEPNEQRSFPATEGTYYVLMRNSTFLSANAEFKNVMGAFGVNHSFMLECGADSHAVVIEYKGIHLLENRYYVQNDLGIGNLSYMDGGTNTTAVNPSRLGDPVVNYVHFPNHMYQTLHTHPSHRVGLILRGSGHIELDNQEIFDIKTGDCFWMPRNTLHNFCCQNGEHVELFVFAPDSGTGPTDEVNPLKIRTYVGQQRYTR